MYNLKILILGEIWIQINSFIVKSILKAKELVSESLEHVLTDASAIKSMITMSAYDYYTYSHSVNVSIYSLGLGRHLGMNKEQLNLLGSSALLHDLGKSKVAPELINKRGRLTEDEFEIVKGHPSLGYELLKKYGEKSFQILGGARHHHEKFDGTGYPKGLKGEDIPLFGRIILIADVFDALSTKRSYKEAMPTFEALKLMKNQMAGHFDPKLFASFIKFMQQ